MYLRIVTTSYRKWDCVLKKKIKKYFRQDICQCVHIPSVKKLESNKRKNLYLERSKIFKLNAKQLKKIRDGYCYKQKKRESLGNNLFTLIVVFFVLRNSNASVNESITTHHPDSLVTFDNSGNAPGTHQSVHDTVNTK